jgi:beta-N-acetylhexosaminidase
VLRAVAVVVAVACLPGAAHGGAVTRAPLSAAEKAALVVVSGLPAPPGVGGVIVQRWSRSLPRPRGALVFVDQEGGPVRAFRELPPRRPARAFARTADAFLAGRAAGRALRRAGVHVNLAPVLDLADGPLGTRHFRRPALGVAFARGLAAAGTGACAKHFPGLGSASISTDLRPHVDARVRSREVAAFRSAIRAGVPCVMTSNAFYGGAPFRASINPATYRLLRSAGFDGLAMTDSLSIVRSAPVERWSRQAIRAGADVVLFTSPAFARRAIRALEPLARRGELDAAVARVLRFRARYGVRARPRRGRRTSRRSCTRSRSARRT